MDLEFGRLLFSLIITVGVSTALFVVLMRMLERRRQSMQRKAEEQRLASVAEVKAAPVSQPPAIVSAVAIPTPVAPQASPAPRPASVAPAPVAPKPSAPPVPPSRKEELPIWE